MGGVMEEEEEKGGRDRMIWITGSICKATT